MTKTSLLAAACSFILLASCKNKPTPAAEPHTPGQNNLVKPVPDANDLLQTLQGLWQSEQDSTYFLEINDTQMRHLSHVRLIHESMIDVDGACQSPVCRPDGVDTSDGWCFTEISVEEEKYVAQCNFVVRCDTSRLEYRSLSGTGKSLIFKKIQ